MASPAAWFPFGSVPYRGRQYDFTAELIDGCILKGSFADIRNIACGYIQPAAKIYTLISPYSYG
ncbi:hypothetical protein Barb7_01591 [Bacteroidales bacterium Barb7]|nr:hypothetical protein Barb7_01591 [Bacteroidales bacterium Barb7]